MDPQGWHLGTSTRAFILGGGGSPRWKLDEEEDGEEEKKEEEERIDWHKQLNIKQEYK
jgi:hypothetical protein